MRKGRAWLERGLTAMMLYGLLAVFGAALVMRATARLIGGIAGALSAAWNGPPWTGDLAVGLLVPALVLGLALRTHRRHVRRTRAESHDDD